MNITAPDPDPLAPIGATIHLNLNTDYEDEQSEFLSGEAQGKNW